MHLVFQSNIFIGYNVMPAGIVWHKRCLTILAVHITLVYN